MSDEAHGFGLRDVGPGHAGDGGDTEAMEGPAGDALLELVAPGEQEPEVGDFRVAVGLEARRVGVGVAGAAQAVKQAEKLRVEGSVVDAVAFDAEADGAGDRAAGGIVFQADIGLGVELGFGDAAALPAGDVEGVTKRFVVGVMAFGFDQPGDEFKLVVGDFGFFLPRVGPNFQPLERVVGGEAAGDRLAHEEAGELQVVEAGVVVGDPESGVGAGAPLDIGGSMAALQLAGGVDFLFGEEGGEVGPAAFPDGPGVTLGRVLARDEGGHPVAPVLAPDGDGLAFFQGALGFELPGHPGFGDLVMLQAGGFAPDLAVGRAVFDPPVGRAGALVERGHEGSVPACALGGKLKVNLDGFRAGKVSNLADRQFYFICNRL